MALSYDEMQQLFEQMGFIGRNTETLEDYFLKLTGEVDRSC